MKSTDTPKSRSHRDRIVDSDFHYPPGSNERRNEIRIRCKFEDLTMMTGVVALGHEEVLVYTENLIRID
jgi:hypothetical protein